MDYNLYGVYLAGYSDINNGAFWFVAFDQSFKMLKWLDNDVLPHIVLVLNFCYGLMLQAKTSIFS